MPEGDRELEALRAAIEEVAAADAPDLLAEARAEARVHGRLAERTSKARLHPLPRTVSGRVEGYPNGWERLKLNPSGRLQT
jgi:hypothetical protein